jgi:hypothetical protein
VGIRQEDSLIIHDLDSVNETRSLLCERRDIGKDRLFSFIPGWQSRGGGGDSAQKLFAVLLHMGVEESRHTCEVGS